MILYFENNNYIIYKGIIEPGEELFIYNLAF